ncbi:Hpt domain-containing protein [Endozoicomonas lisbonensis]
MLDLTNLQLITDGNKTLLNSLLTEFIRTTDDDLKELNNAIKDQQHDSIIRLSHRIKGAAAIVGASELVELTAELEAAGCQSGLNNSLELLKRIMHCYENVSEEINHYN